MRRFKIEKKKIKADTCLISGSNANHMINVLRLKAGDGVALFDGEGGEYDARIEAICRGAVRLAIENSRSCQTEAFRPITVAQGFLNQA